jgi:hypothetical protein
MPDQRGKLAPKRRLPKPKITSLSKWPIAEIEIRERALAQGVKPEEIELLLADIREARKGIHDEQKKKVSRR